MVVDTPEGKVTVFIVPEQSPAAASFNDKTMAGIVMPLQNASLIVVGDKNADMQPVAKTIKSELQWQI
ncbi:hypothetical protein AB733_09945 [Photobacterium swingsii]|nr:hypothetical protein AB733_09945 [Photobacterium swingsii]